jgi:hypothetical protein
MNISNNLISCPLCKNIFLKTHIKIHYQNCKNKKPTKIITEKKISPEVYKKKEELLFNELRVDNYIKPEIITYNDSMLNYFFKEYEKLFLEYIHGKCIALVGPAQSILNTQKGHIIDKFDLVVRLNKSIPLPSSLKADIGGKTDILYNSLNTSDFPGENNLNPKLYKKYGIKFVCSSYPFNHNIFHDDISNYVYKYKFELPLKVMNDLKFRNFEKMLGTRPYTGTCAIMDLLSYPIKFLYITGLDFYQTKYYSEYRHISKEGLKYSKNNIIHQAKPQMDYLKNISLLDNRIILDDFLDKLLYNDYYKVIKNLLSFNKDQIFNFGDSFLQKYFELKVSYCTFTRMETINKKDKNEYPYLIFTDNKYYNKNNNEYCLYITKDKEVLNILNGNLVNKKFIGNFYFNGNSNTSIYLSSKFLSFIKSTLSKINISNCNINLAILISILLYLPDKHFFDHNEIFNRWMINNEEKKFLLFLIKKNILHCN